MSDDPFDYWFKWKPARFRKKTMHLCPYQDGLYRRLIDEYMLTRSPLPDNDAALSRICGVSLSDFAPHSGVVRAFFRVRKGVLFHPTCEGILRDQEEANKIRRERAKKGGKAKAEKNNKNNAVSALSRPQAEHKQPKTPLFPARGEESREEEKRIKKEKKVRTPLPPEGECAGFENFWAGYPKQRAGRKEKALQAYRKAITEKRATAEEINHGVSAYRTSDEVSRGFAKGAAAWLADDRWKNDYSPQQRQGGQRHQPQASYLDKVQAAGNKALDSLNRRMEAERDAPWNQRNPVRPAGQPAAIASRNHAAVAGHPDAGDENAAGDDGDGNAG